MKTVTFRDRAKVYVYAGNGGDGSASFRREKFVPKGGPDGGDGGHGGSIYLRADKDQSSLLDLYYKPHQRATHGVNGSGQQCTGRCGEDRYVDVPCGTQAFDFESGDFIGEVIHDGDTLLVAKGGRGGKGNINFKSSTNQAPTQYIPGEEGEQKILRLELKIVAEVGLVGYPNAGKSTLLSAMTGAKPKVASYPFTTLNPIIGTIMFDNYKTLKIADIPGLVDGAHEGIGLGHDFLRHIERTKFLVFVLDMAGTDGRHPADDYENLRKELKLYNETLSERPYFIVANKMDMPEAENYYKEFVERFGENPLKTCAELAEGVDAVKSTLYERLIIKTL